MTNKHLPIALLILSGLLLTSVSLGLTKKIKIATTETQMASLLVASNQNSNPEDFAQPDIEDPFKKINLIARSAIVLDIKTGEIIFAKNIHERLPLASITKVMTALAADNLTQLPQNFLVTIKPEDLEPEGDSGLSVGQIWKLKDLVDFSLIVSSNDGARAIAGVAANHESFIAEMNNQAQELNLEKTIFRNESGLDLPNYGGASAQGSAENVARLFAYIHNNKPGLLEATKKDSAIFSPINSDPHFITNTNSAISQIPGLIASKTGFTDLSGGNLAVTFDRGLNQPVVAVVLGSTHQGRFSDMVKLTEATIESLQITLTANQK